MKNPKAVDLPNFGVLECDLEQSEIDSILKK